MKPLPFSLTAPKRGGVPGFPSRSPPPKPTPTPWPGSEQEFRRIVIEVWYVWVRAPGFWWAGPQALGGPGPKPREDLDAGLFCGRGRKPSSFLPYSLKTRGGGGGGGRVYPYFVLLFEVRVVGLGPGAWIPQPTGLTRKVPANLGCCTD